MASHEPKDSIQSLLKHVDVSRRTFVRRLVSGAFAVPVVASFSMDRLTIGTTFAQSSNIPGSNIPGSNIPGSNIPGSNIPGSNIPGSNTPGSIEVLLRAAGDAILRRDWRNVNEGANPRLRVGKEPLTRVVIAFDDTQLFSILGNSGFILQAAHLILTVETNHHNWGQFDDRTIDAHPLLEPFTEGNGKQIGLSGAGQTPGTGAGVTWNSPDDPDVSLNKPPRASMMILWKGGNFGPATAAGVVHTNALDRGDAVMWDVTMDVFAGRAAWLLKLTDERPARSEDEDRPPKRLPKGFEVGIDNTIEYYSREGAALARNEQLAPRLVLMGTMGIAS